MVVIRKFKVVYYICLFDCKLIIGGKMILLVLMNKVKVIKFNVIIFLDDKWWFIVMCVV